MAGIPTDGIPSSEARHVPLILTNSPTRNIGNGSREEDLITLDWAAEGFHEDEAVVAPIEIGPAERPSPFPSAQRRYYRSLLSRFKNVQRQLRAIPSSSETSNLKRPVQFQSGLEADRARWHQTTRTLDPAIVQLRRLDAASTFALLQLLTQEMSTLRPTEAAGVRRFGAWAWVTLAKTPQIETLASEEIAEVRELGKAAIEVLTQSIESGNDLLHKEDTSERIARRGADFEAITGTDSEFMDQSRRTLLHSLEEEPLTCSEYQAPNLQRIINAEWSNEESGALPSNGAFSSRPTQILGMVLEMIITIVGEIYGQRDLLDHRLVWTK